VSAHALCQDCIQSIPLQIRRGQMSATRKKVPNTYTFGSETFNIPRSARYGSFSLNPSLVTCSAPDAEPKQNSIVSSESYISHPQSASMVLQYCGFSNMGSMVATVRCSRLCKAWKVLRRIESDQGAPAPSDAIVRDRRRGIIRFKLRNAVGKVSLSHWSNVSRDGNWLPNGYDSL